jgi:hypothetical protein
MEMEEDMEKKKNLTSAMITKQFYDWGRTVLEPTNGYRGGGNPSLEVKRLEREDD